jgi:hypothetical protein
VIWRVFPKNTKISEIGSRKNTKKNPNCLGPKNDKICREKQKTTTRLEESEKNKLKKIRKKVQNLQQQ